MERGKDKAPCPQQGNGALQVFYAAPSCFTPPGSQSGFRINKRYIDQGQKLLSDHTQTCRGGQEFWRNRKHGKMDWWNNGILEEWKDGKPGITDRRSEIGNSKPIDLVGHEP
jgi:hypothetical protein